MNASGWWLLIAILVGLYGWAYFRPKRTPIDPKAAELSRLPTGIEVVHTPSTVKAMEGVQQQFRYTWLYKTRVRSTVGPLKIVEFGAFTLIDGQRVFKTYTGKPFTSEDFASWYACPNAELTMAGTFTDPQNWTGAKILPKAPIQCGWYYIGVDRSGKRYKGETTTTGLPQVSVNGK